MFIAMLYVRLNERVRAPALLTTLLMTGALSGCASAPDPKTCPREDLVAAERAARLRAEAAEAKLREIDSRMRQELGTSAEQFASGANWSFGYHGSMVLFPYIERQSSSVPAYCRSASRVLIELNKQINKDTSPGHCTSHITDSPLGGELLSVACKLDADTKGCTNNYVAVLWTERDPNSRQNYTMRALSFIRKYCEATKTFYEPTRTELEAASQRGEPVMKFIAECQE
jgi:hypothetical protein